ncbi:MAG: tyrosine-type recombinase/integrase [Paludibacter sp.]
MLTFYDINYEILSLYKIFLENEHDLCIRYSIAWGTRKSISNSRKGTTINGYFKKFKTFIFHYKKLLNESYNPFADFKIDSDIFGKPICLTNDEFYYLLNLKLENHRLQKIKDIFVLNCLTSFRVSDFFKLSQSDIINNKIEFYPSKTSKFEIMVEVPLNDTATEIISKYKCDSNYIVPRMSLKTYNKGLKELFEMVGLDRKVTYINSESKQTEHAPLYEKVSSHLARRTFISLLVNAGVSDRIICSMTGHKPHSREISRYYTIDQETQRDALNSLKSKLDFSDLLNNNGDLFKQLKTVK